MIDAPEIRNSGIFHIEACSLLQHYSIISKLLVGTTPVIGITYPGDDTVHHLHYAEHYQQHIGL